MYSRNTVRRQQPSLQYNRQENPFTQTLTLPPNYGGMMYSDNIITEPCSNENRITEEENSPEVLPKCICDIAGEDSEFCKSVELTPPLKQNETPQKESGISKLAEGLKFRSFSAEDILLIAVILLILSENNQSESVILPLLMLLI